MTVDVLAVSPHPDDVELHCGGFMIKMADAGYRTAVVDLTRGEMGTRGTVEKRRAETRVASEILGLAARENLALPDTGIATTPEQRLAVIRAIRTYRPRLLLLPYHAARHPDHTHASQLVQDAAFLAGLAKIDTGQEPHRSPQLICYLTHYRHRDAVPSFIVDISEHFDKKLKAIRAYASQFYNPASSEPETYISRPEFLDEIEMYNRYCGLLIGARYGEPFIIREHLAIDDPVAHFMKK